MMTLSTETVESQIWDLEATFTQYDLEWADERACELEYDGGMEARAAYLQALRELESQREEAAEARGEWLREN